MLDQLGRADAGAAGQQREHGALGLHRVADDEVELGAVAGGEHDGLVDRRVRRQLAQERLACPSVQRQPLAHRQRRGLVRGAEGEQLAHRGTGSSASLASAAAARARRAARQLAELALDARQLGRP